MNQYVKSVQAALRATAPFVAIPVEGHAPACVRAKLLKGALKGVTVTSVKILTADPKRTSDSGRWLEIKGRADGGVRTSCKMVVLNVKDYNVWKELSRWTDREREKRIKVASQGALNPAERKALKLAEAMAKEEKRRNAELIAAQREEAEILADVRGGILPVITPKEPEERADVIAEYAAFHASRPNRKRGSVIRWRLNKLREQVKEMTVEKREYKEVESCTPMSRWHRKRRECVAVTKVLRRKGDTLRYAAAVYQIGQLEAQYKALYPPLWRAWGSDPTNGMLWDTWVEKRPNSQAYSVTWHWHDGCVQQPAQVDEEGEVHLTGIRWLAERLRVARASIRSLTPPADEDEQELPLAA